MSDCGRKKTNPEDLGNKQTKISNPVWLQELNVWENRLRKLGNRQELRSLLVMLTIVAQHT